LEDSFLQLNWSDEAKINTYTRRPFQPRLIEEVVLAYLNGDTSTQRCTSDFPDRAIIQQLIPNSNKVFRVVVGIRGDPWTIISFYSSSARRKFFKKIKHKKKHDKQKTMTEHDKQEPLAKFIANFTYYDDTNALVVNFTEEPDELAEDATKYILVYYNQTDKIMAIRIDSPTICIRGITNDKPSFTLNPTYDEERDIFKINFADSISMTTFQKTDVEDVEIEIDDEGKLVAILFHNANIKMANMCVK
ncbi:2259_t:CDS:2, partial [Diversispora eburnea]